MQEHEDEFAIPIVQLWEHLLVPIQGEISDQQAAELSAAVLEAVHRTGAANLLIDVSGVAIMDSHLCATFARLASSARMMGVRSVISGLTPEIVMTLQTMGVEMEEIHTTLNLEEALMMLGIGKLSTVHGGDPSPYSLQQAPPYLAQGGHGWPPRPTQQPMASPFGPSPTAHPGLPQGVPYGSPAATAMGSMPPMAQPGAPPDAPMAPPGAATFRSADLPAWPFQGIAQQHHPMGGGKGSGSARAHASHGVATRKGDHND